MLSAETTAAGLPSREDKLASENEDLLELLYSSPIGLMQIGPDGNIRMSNAVALSMCIPYCPKARVDNLFTALGDGAADLRAKILSYRPVRGKICDSLRVTVKQPDGQLTGVVVWVLTAVKRDDTSIWIVLSDVSQQVIQEGRLRQAATLLGSIMEVIPGLIYVKNKAGELVTANKAMVDLTGQSWSAMHGMAASDLAAACHPIAPILARDDQVLAGQGLYWVEDVIVDRDKGPRIYASTKVPFGGSNNMLSGMVSLSYDVTDQNALRDEVLHLSRRTAMGDMAAAIAHEINQPLAAIVFYLSAATSLRVGGPNGDSADRMLALATDECLRAGEIIRRIRSFVASGVREKVTESICPLVDTACQMPQIDARHRHVALLIEHAEPDLYVHVARIEIEQVVVNLVRNALESIGCAEGGVIEVTTASNADGMVVVSVSDNGPGIAPDVIDRIFDPFVTTKGGDGLGVGLSVCRTIVESYGGKIWAHADRARGATIAFSLPRAPDPATP